MDFLGEKHATHRSVMLPAHVFTLARIHTQERAGSVVLRHILAYQRHIQCRFQLRYRF